MRSEKNAVASRPQQERAYRNRKMATGTGFLKYAWETLRAAAFYEQWLRILSYLRRLRLVALILRLGTILLTVLQTGALVLLTTVLFLIAIPVLIFFTLGILLTALLESRKTNRTLSRLLCGKKVYVLFATDSPTPFFIGNARQLSSLKDTAVLIVSPFWLSSKGILRKGFYGTARREAQNIYTLRRYYFFSLQKQVLRHLETAYLY